MIRSGVLISEEVAELHTAMLRLSSPYRPQLADITAQPYGTVVVSAAEAGRHILAASFPARLLGVPPHTAAQRVAFKITISPSGQVLQIQSISGDSPCGAQKQHPSLRGLLREPVFVMQAAEYGSLHHLVSDRQTVSVQVGRKLVRDGLRHTGA
jgi:hypothetical protein